MNELLQKWPRTFFVLGLGMAFLTLTYLTALFFLGLPDTLSPLLESGGKVSFSKFGSLIIGALIAYVFGEIFIVFGSLSRSLFFYDQNAATRLATIAHEQNQLLWVLYSESTLRRDFLDGLGGLLVVTATLAFLGDLYLGWVSLNSPLAVVIVASFGVVCLFISSRSFKLLDAVFEHYKNT